MRCTARTVRLWLLALAAVPGVPVSVPAGPAAGAPAPHRASASRRPSHYPDGDPSAAWDTDAVDWKVRKGILEYEGAGTASAVPRPAPAGRRVIVEAVVIPRRPTASGYRMAGVEVRRDESNYWHLALVEAPDAQNRAHYAELLETRDDRWGAQVLPIETGRGMRLDWRYGRPYRLRIELDAHGITGIVMDAGGAELARRAYPFGPAAVKTGAPALIAINMAAGFTGFRADVRDLLPRTPPPAYPPYVGPRTALLRGRKTGFFHVERLGGRWWMVDPAGRSFFAVGADQVRYTGFQCEKLGYAPYLRNVEKEFGGSEERWAADSVARLKRWRFNLLGVISSASTRHRGLAHVGFLSLGALFASSSSIVPQTNWVGLPDVYDPRWRASCELRARRICAAQRDDPWLLGYFIDNELEWFGKSGSPFGVAIEAFKCSPDRPAKRALIALLRSRYHDIAAFNRAWSTGFADWDSLAASRTPPLIGTENARNDAHRFLLDVARRYFAVACAAIRKADPNHMVLGCRFGGDAPPGIVGVAGRYCDVVSINYYGKVDLERGISPDMPGKMRAWYAEARRPLFMSEWSFPALDSGLPCRGGAGQRVPTQRDRARCFAVYQRALFGMPFMVGSDYFMWMDEPALAISASFPEDSNYGLVDNANHTWTTLTAEAARVNAEAQRLHAGNSPDLRVTILDSREAARSHPHARRCTSHPMFPSVSVANRGGAGASFDLRITVQGRPTSRRLFLAPGHSARIALAAHNPVYVVAEADPAERLLMDDRSRCRAEAVVNVGQSRRPVVVVLNPTARALADVPLSVPLPGAAVRWTIPGRTAQTDLMPEGAWLSWRAPILPARSVTTFPLDVGTAALSLHESGGDRALHLNGVLSLDHAPGSGSFFDTVALARLARARLALGKFGCLIRQGQGPYVFAYPTGITRIDVWTGPVRTLLRMSAVWSPSAASSGAAGSFRATYRFTWSAHDPWFAARFDSLDNTGERPWYFGGYYLYPLSAIDGRDDDRPAGTGETPLWWSPSAQACYGALVDTSRMRAVFWRDPQDSNHEKPDICRDIDLAVAPGAAVKATGADAEVLIYGALGPSARSGGDVLPRLVAIRKVRAWIAYPNPNFSTETNRSPSILSILSILSRSFRIPASSLISSLTSARPSAASTKRRV